MDASQNGRPELQRHLRTLRFVIAGLLLAILGLSLALALQVSDPDDSIPSATISVAKEDSSNQAVLRVPVSTEREIDLEWVLDHVKDVSPEHTNYELQRKWGSIIRIQDAMIFFHLHELLETLDPSARKRLLAEQAAWQNHADAESDESRAEYPGGTFASVAACARYSELAEERIAVLGSMLDARNDI